MVQRTRLKNGCTTEVMQFLVVFFLRDAGRMALAAQNFWICLQVLPGLEDKLQSPHAVKTAYNKRSYDAHL